MKAKAIIGSIIILAAMAWGITSFMGTTVQYVSIAEARTAPKACTLFITELSPAILTKPRR
jgi:hypothetical protein